MLQTCCPLDFVSSVSVALLHLSWYANSVYILLYSWFTMRLPLIFISTMELGRSPCYCVACCYSIKYLLPFPLLFFCKSSCFWPLEDGHSFSFFCIQICLDLSSFFLFLVHGSLLIERPSTWECFLLLFSCFALLFPRFVAISLLSSCFFLFHLLFLWAKYYILACIFFNQYEKIIIPPPFINVFFAFILLFFVALLCAHFKKNIKIQDGFFIGMFFLRNQTYVCMGF